MQAVEERRCSAVGCPHAARFRVAHWIEPENEWWECEEHVTQSRERGFDVEPLSERSGRYAGEHVEWRIPAGHEVYDPGEGAGVVTVPYDGGFVWIDDGHIVPMEFVHPVDKGRP